VKTVLRIRDLSVGDRIAVRWHPGQQPVVGTVVSVITAASRASGSYMRTDAGQAVRMKASMTIERV
jgi:hypothetical protein